jgi:basic membrane lipoprotein Med (substrate-binding protein (PBP1-ABC) superfamily)
MTRFLRGLCLVTLVAAVALATGCGGDDDNTSSSAGTGSAATSAKKEGLKVGFVYVSPIPGSAWSSAWDVTRKDLEQKFGAKTTVVQPIPENTEVVGTFNDLIRKGNKLIFATAFGYQPFVAQVAKQNPDVYFVVTGPWAQKEDRPPNVSSVYANLWEVRYLTGMIAASMSKKKTLGFVSAFSIPSVVAGINGFEQGAKSVDPNIKTKVVLTSNWYNPPQSTQAAETLAKNGADVIAKHEDSVGPLLGAKAAGVWGIGSEADTSSQTPDTYLTGSVYDWTQYSEKKYQEAVDGNFTNEEVNGDLKSGMVKLGPINDKVPADVKSKVEEAQKQIEDGSLVVFKGPVKSNTGETKLPAGKEWTSPADVYANMTFFVDGVQGKIQK